MRFTYLCQKYTFMSELSITITRLDVYTEVMKATEYTGAKWVDDAGAYDRIRTTDQDAQLLDRFFDDAASDLMELTKLFSPSYTLDATGLTVTLTMPSNYDESLNDGVRKAARSLFVNSILSAWCLFANKQEAASYSALAQGFMTDMRNKLYFRKKPTRTVI